MGLILTIWVTACWADSCGRGCGQRAKVDGLDAYARPPRSLREPTRWNLDKSKNSTIRTGKKQLEIRETRPCVCNGWTLSKVLSATQ